MPKARDVYDNPNDFWTFLTATDDGQFEGQYFDRKQAGRLDGSAFDKTQMLEINRGIVETVSAFANANREGSLLVIGITKTGEVGGINHIPDSQRTSLTKIGDHLKNQCAECRFHDCVDRNGDPNQICLIYVPHTEHNFCEENGNSPKAWYREGSRNQELNDARRDQLKRDKKIVDFEQAFCCPFDLKDVDQAVLREYRESIMTDSDADYDDVELLYNAGAIVQYGTGYAFNNAGLLFFAANPQRILSWSYIRLMRFEAYLAEMDDRGLPIVEREFKGPIAQQIRNIRTFFQQSAFFKNYQFRNPDGGFTEELEYPFNVVDEGIVNAIAHGDHAVHRPIECEAYKDALVIRNPGRVLQRDQDVPQHFTLATTILHSAPRNRKLLEWLKKMRDDRGRSFVRELSEGTRTMRREMAKLNLPPPQYDLTSAQTTLTLFNNADAREARMKAMASSESSEFANLFPVDIVSQGDRQPGNRRVDEQRELLDGLQNALKGQKWFIHNVRFGRLVASPPRTSIALPENLAHIFRLFPAYSFQFRQYWGQHYLCIDFRLEVRNRLTIQSLLSLLPSTELFNRTALVKWENEWRRARILSIDSEWTRVRLFDFESEETIASDRVVPDLPVSLIDQVLMERNITYDLHRMIKLHSLSLTPGGARVRADKTQAVASELARTVFPLQLQDTTAIMQPKPAPLLRQSGARNGFHVQGLEEPSVEFHQHRHIADIREGITKFGSYDDIHKTVELVPICTADVREKMAGLIERLKTGAYKYRGSERTFYTKLGYSSIVTVPSTDKILEECRRLFREHPDWTGDTRLSRLFLVHTPEAGYASDDEQSPYYQIKRFLLEQGVPCQMVDTPTLNDPNWKDLNLALNIIAKSGVTPWVLPGGIPDADFFLGLSYTQNGRGDNERLMGYANVFNSYGRWEFYSGNTEAFPYSQKTLRFQTLITQTLERLSAEGTLSPTPSIYFHYSAKFSREDKDAILHAARAIRPNGTYTFVWINTHHTLRLYDSRAETDGSLRRGSYVVTSPHQMYLSTTGSNPYRKALGTPQMLEINAWVEQPEGTSNSRPDMRALATQILSLTKLNWASTDSLCAEPITIKYAGDIAYLTAAFMRQAPDFRLNHALERTPWFL
ncbi:MAG: putative transcriptional regulator [Chthonomonadaceae bacterium]|nr:putative transcriptional regulator [Chthonomonadaceae bacterium]